MIRLLFSLVLLASAAGAGAAPVSVSLLRTAQMPVREGLLYAGGSFGKQAVTVFSAVLVRHGDTLLLFDTGLGRAIAQQYAADMPRWQRPFFKYAEPVTPVRDQLEQVGLGPVGSIILSHSHWDHASGVPDFPEAALWVAAPELEAIGHPSSRVGGAWPSQVGGTAKWQTLAFAPTAYEGFERSLDLYGDASVVLVPLFGHTAGSVGMFVTSASGRRYFFCGDASWSAAALPTASPKFWAARLLVDQDARQTQATLEKISAVQRAHPELMVVPAHDGAVQQSLGYFPQWLP